jgi:hypothetical protein
MLDVGREIQPQSPRPLLQPVITPTKPTKGVAALFAEAFDKLSHHLGDYRPK